MRAMRRSAGWSARTRWDAGAGKTARSCGEDGRPHAWYRDLDKDVLAEEQLFLAEKVYRGASRHERVRIDYSNRFSDRV